MDDDDESILRITIEARERRLKTIPGLSDGREKKTQQLTSPHTDGIAAQAWEFGKIKAPVL